jgi:hypothetical protein
VDRLWRQHRQAGELGVRAARIGADHGEHQKLRVRQAEGREDPVHPLALCVGGLAQQVAQIACLAALAAVGVRRVSVGGALARATWTAFEDMAERLWTQGRLPQ